jgi:DNA integrity scanning protein DisA with diadenylate cyclase activity
MDPKGKGMVINDKEKESFLNELETTSQPTQARVTRKETERRRGASRRSSTVTVMPRLLHHTTTMTPRQRRNRLIKTIHLIILVFHSILMLICYQFHLENLHTLMEKTTHFGVIKCVVIYFLSILAFGK